MYVRSLKKACSHLSPLCQFRIYRFLQQKSDAIFPSKCLHLRLQQARPEEKLTKTVLDKK